MTPPPPPPSSQPCSITGAQLYCPKTQISVLGLIHLGFAEATARLQDDPLGYPAGPMQGGLKFYDSRLHVLTGPTATTDAEQSLPSRTGVSSKVSPRPKRLPGFPR